MIDGLRRLLPRPIKTFVSHVSKSLFYKDYDSSAYWKQRAKQPGQAAVLWKNEAYNNLYRNDQKDILSKWTAIAPDNPHILDIGCGIGIVSDMLISLRPDASVVAVDFPEMIEVAKNRDHHGNITFVESSAEAYDAGEGVYDFIISSGCYSAIRHIPSLEQALRNGAKMLKTGGTMVLIDPFHRWNYLARAKYNSKNVESLLATHGLTILEKSGVLFWPFRVWLASSEMSSSDTELHYRRGEKLLRSLGPHFWADYKVLVFRKDR